MLNPHVQSLKIELKHLIIKIDYGYDIYITYYIKTQLFDKSKFKKKN